MRCQTGSAACSSICISYARCSLAYELVVVVVVVVVVIVAAVAEGGADWGVQTSVRRHHAGRGDGRSPRSHEIRPRRLASWCYDTRSHFPYASRAPISPLSSRSYTRAVIQVRGHMRLRRDGRPRRVRSRGARVVLWACPRPTHRQASVSFSQRTCSTALTTGRITSLS